MSQSNSGHVVNAPRLLFIGEFGVVNPTPYFSTALRTSGWQVIETDFSRFFPRLGQSFIMKIFGHIFSRVGMKELTRTIERDAIRNNVDCVFFTKALGATTDLIEKLNSRGVTTVCWHPDYHFNYVGLNKDTLPLYDIFITTKDFQMDYLNNIRPGKRNALVEHGYCDEVHWRQRPDNPWSARKFDVGFVGTYSIYKEKWMTDLVSHRPNLKYLIVGGGWQQVQWPNSAASVTVRNAMSGEAMSQVLNQCRLAVAVHHGPVGNSEGWQDSVSARTFEIPACGTPMIHIAGNHLHNLFEIGEEVVCFDDIETLVSNVDQLLADPSQALQMAERAYERAVPQYGYTARGNEIAQLLDQCGIKKRAMERRSN